MNKTEQFKNFFDQKSIVDHFPVSVTNEGLTHEVFDPKGQHFLEFDHFIDDSDTAPKGLSTVTRTTHGFRMTRKGALYLPSSLRDSVPSLLHPYPVPVKPKHRDPQGNRDIDAIGRVTGGKYVDDIDRNARGFSVNDAIQGSYRDKKTLDAILDGLRSRVLLDTNFEGLGYMLVNGMVNDPESIEKILDGRYLTVSVEMTPSGWINPMTGNSWEDDIYALDYAPGDIVDGIPAIMIPADLRQEGYAYTTHPADTFAATLNYGRSELLDSIVERARTPMAIFDAKRPGPKSSAQTPAKPEERKKGSKKNKEGSAGSSTGKITVSAKVETALKNKIAEYKKSKPKAKHTPTLGQLKAVYRRGAGAFSSSHRPGKTRNQWAMARVNQFIKMIGGGSVKASYRKADGDLLPSGHPSHLDSSEQSVEDQLLNVFDTEMGSEEPVEDAEGAVPPEGVRKAAANGLERHKKGETGKGIEAATIAAARRLAAGESIGVEQLRKGNRFWARNERFLKAEQGSPAWASAQLWGGRAGMSWYRAQVKRLDKAEDSVEDMYMKEKEEDMSCSCCKGENMDNCPCCSWSKEEMDEISLETLYDNEYWQDLADYSDIDIKDARLSAAQRNALPDSAFCGPNRSFPANDCAHVRAGLRLLNRANVSEGTRDKIKGCLNKKNESMSCGIQSAPANDSDSCRCKGGGTKICKGCEGKYGSDSVLMDGWVEALKEGKEAYLHVEKLYAEITACDSDAYAAEAIASGISGLTLCGLPVDNQEVFDAVKPVIDSIVNEITDASTKARIEAINSVFTSTSHPENAACGNTNTDSSTIADNGEGENMTLESILEFLRDNSAEVEAVLDSIFNELDVSYVKQEVVDGLNSEIAELKQKNALVEDSNRLVQLYKDQLQTSLFEAVQLKATLDSAMGEQRELREKLEALTASVTDEAPAQEQTVEDSAEVVAEVKEEEVVEEKATELAKEVEDASEVQDPTLDVTDAVEDTQDPAQEGVVEDTSINFNKNEVAVAKYYGERIQQGKKGEAAKYLATMKRNAVVADSFNPNTVLEALGLKA